MNVLEITNLTKRYGKLTAVNNLNLTVKAGQVFGVLGPNGSGKTTTLGCVLGITKADFGDFTWFSGKYGASPLRKVGALLETPNFYTYLNAVDNLRIVAHLKQDLNNFDQRTEEILKTVNLWHRRDTPFKAYSLGMKQRLAIASTLVGDPDLMIFDEPTNGLDPTGIAEVRQSILNIAASGKTIIIASHMLDEVEKVCSDVAIIKNGNLLAQGSVGGILKQQPTIEIAAKDLDILGGMLADINFVEKIEKMSNGHLSVQLSEGKNAFDISQLVFEKGIVLTHLNEKKRRLEEEFLAITAKAS
ncbi:MAG: hypothetical protein RL757_1033 [Bacteroidota bacterium]|jgi:ABC-2 type transport system ATP-binding protein